MPPLRHRLARPLALAAAPVLLPQAWWTRRTTPRLPEAPGPRAGHVGDSRAGHAGDAVAGPVLSLAVIGESTAVGVGVNAQEDALAAHLARLLADGGPVAWRAVGRSGHRVARTLRETVPLLDPGLDVVVVATGVNDVMALTSLRRWRAGVTAMVDALGPRVNAGGWIVLSGLPPLRRFPALPQPARALAGRHADALDDVLAAIAAPPRVLHVPISHLAGPGHIAGDGFHPSVAGYAAWAATIAAALRANGLTVSAAAG